MSNYNFRGPPSITGYVKNQCLRATLCRQFHERKTCTFFVRTLFSAAFSSYMYVVKAANMYVRTKNSYV